ncbi:MAG: DNA polymerase III subunit delta [Candidatus Doudnabacteria bacterium]|nr:DNA polymerase III subunit delta [Candidatus Doudnabacteria bacterium]MCA9387541.1 DNA polymerase III subunit delta [Candidatus Andersenbacteria bacterium]
MILFLYGTDVDAVRTKTRALIEKFKEKDPQGLNLAELDGDTTTVKALRDASEAMPFLASSRLVVVKRFLQEASKEQQETLLEWLQEDKLPETTVLVFAEPGAPDKRTKAFKWISKNTTVQEYKAPEGGDAIAFASQLLGSEGFELVRDAAAELVSRVGDNSVRLRNELEKLMLYVTAEGRTQITKADVEVLVVGEVHDEIFLLTDALARRDRTAALQLLHRQLEKGASAHYLHSMFVFQIRNLLLISDGLSRGLSEQAIAKEAGLHPYVVKKTAQVAKKFKEGQLEAIHGALARMDRSFKTSQVDPVLALDLFVTSVAA